MNKERYKYTPNIEALSAFDNFTKAEMSTDAQKSIYTKSDNGYEIEVERGELCSGVVRIDFHYEAGKEYSVANTVRMATNSHLRMIIYHHSTSQAKIKESLHIELGSGAKLEIVVIADTHSLLLSNYTSTTHRDSTLKITTLDLNNQTLVRNQMVNMIESGSECTINGLYLTSRDEHADNYVKINHSTAHCTSNQLFKGVMADKSTAAFTGHILVAQDAQQTAAYQQNHNILLSDAARIDTRPQLEIYADDVKCNHGATVGRLDPEAIYYIRQRGIPVEAARRLQLTGFAEDVAMLDNFDDLHNTIRQKIEHKLETL